MNPQNEETIINTITDGNFIDLFTVNKTIIKISDDLTTDKYYLCVKKTNNFIIFKELRIQKNECMNIQNFNFYYSATITDEFIWKDKTTKKFKISTLRKRMLKYHRYPMFINYFNEDEINPPFYDFNQSISYKKYSDL